MLEGFLHRSSFGIKNMCGEPLKIANRENQLPDMGAELANIMSCGGGSGFIYLF